MKVLFIGDIVGQPGRQYVAEVLQELLPEHKPDLVVANGENATRGRGLSSHSAEELYDAGVEIVTMGNHTWDQRQIFDFIDDDERIVRPANYPAGTPGRGFTVCRVGRREVLIINVMGRTFLSTIDCPFAAVENILKEHPHIKHIIVDMHAEVTSEKLGMGWEFAGRVSAVLGTHTHVPTADARILPGGTAYISDVGMVGPRNGILGMKRESVIRRMRTQLPAKFEVADGPRQFCAVMMDFDDESGRATRIDPIYRYEPDA
ncbi:TIGR00282 family metallophosphoesterase [Alicyclobacillus fastidiosus]|uniref:TIGR00282 family metallophosphoesterase n=1 Tax=Alicyclobacillus fastidiosus TaxID=392011 RepID=A0ABY6ZBA1_9BACL|nr:TIGR00282 family metallophosphoesterase [Alicyclobacillus fastidiosus]WAH40141.1 TIGR00282 family metallophosphoesterase [Alicyclobacillus fastidiosus]GMA61483.1 metallophosphoesterase [Alicyclobacillus fastidiosus]